MGVLEGGLFLRVRHGGGLALPELRGSLIDGPHEPLLGLQGLEIQRHEDLEGQRLPTQILSDDVHVGDEVLGTGRLAEIERDE